MTAAVRVIIANTSEIEGEGLRRLLGDRAFEIVGVYRALADVPAIDEADQHNTVLLLRAPSDSEAVNTCRSARERWRDIRIAIMATSCDSATVADAIRAGADGYLSPDTSVACLVEMLKLIAMGEKLIPSQLVFELASLKSEASWNDTEVDLSDVNVSERELEILQGLIQGEPNKVISRKLNITEATVKVHVKSILRKLHVLNRTQAAVWALSRGLGQTPASAIIASSEADDISSMTEGRMRLPIERAPSVSHGVVSERAASWPLRQ